MARYIRKYKSGHQYWKLSCQGHPNEDNQGYVLEHRLFMEKKIGRILERHEVVHHKDGNGLNNDMDNV